jgi:hypothetical protein
MTVAVGSAKAKVLFQRYGWSSRAPQSAQLYMFSFCSRPIQHTGQKTISRTTNRSKGTHHSYPRIYADDVKAWLPQAPQPL